MSLNDKIRYDWTTEVPVRKNEIIANLEKRMKAYRWIDYLAVQIDFKEFKIKEGEIEISTKPGMFTPFGPWGKISIRLVEKTYGITKITCDILPMNGILPFIIYSTLGILTLWTLGFLLAASDATIVFAIIGFWGLTAMIVYLQYRYHKSILIDYSKQIVDFVRLKY